MDIVVETIQQEIALEVLASQEVVLEIPKAVIFEWPVTIYHKNNYQLAVQEWFIGTIEEYLESLKGEEGPIGPRGPGAVLPDWIDPLHKPTYTKEEIDGLENVDNTNDLAKPISNATNLALWEKVDKVVGKGLSEENFTTGEKSKLAWLESSRFKGQFVSLIELENAGVEGIGNFAYVDEGVGKDIVQYTRDNDDSKRTKQQGEATAETPASIKSKYESNLDTNNFSDSDKNKLDDLDNIITDLVTPLVPTKTSDLVNDSWYTSWLNIDGWKASSIGIPSLAINWWKA